MKCSRSSQDKDKRLSPGTLAFLDDLHTSLDTDSDTIVMKTPLCQRRRGNNNKEGSTRDSVVMDEVMDEDLQNEYSGEDNVRTNECLSPTPPRLSLVNSPKTIRKATPNRHRPQKQDDRRSARKNIESLGVSMKNSKVPFVESAKSAEEEVREWNSGKLESPTGEDPPYVERGPVVDPNETGIPPSQGTFTIIDVCADKVLFDTFIKEWNCQPSFAISLACINKPRDPVTTTGGIGAKFTEAGDTGHKSSKVKTTEPGVASRGIPVWGVNLVITGVAVSWGDRDAYFITLTSENIEDEEDTDLSPPDLDKSLSVTARLAAIRQVLERKDSFTVIAMDAKACYGALERSCGICCQGKFQDPKVATWLLDPGAKEKIYTAWSMITSL